MNFNKNLIVATIAVALVSSSSVSARALRHSTTGVDAESQARRSLEEEAPTAMPILSGVSTPTESPTDMPILSGVGTPTETL